MAARTKFLTTRVHDSELALLRQAAQAEGRTTCNFVRYHALQAARQAGAKLPRGAEVAHG